MKRRRTEILGAGCAEVRISSVESLTDQLLPTVLAAFHERFPRVRFMVMTGMTDAILEQVVTHDADIGLCINPMPTSKVRFLEQVELEFGAVVAPHHPLAEREALWLKECQAYPVLLPGEEMFHGSTLQQSLAEMDLELEPLATGNRILTLKSLARGGLGIAFLNRLDIARELAHGDLLFKPLLDRNTARARLALCVHSDRALPMATAVLAEQLREAMLAIEP